MYFVQSGGYGLESLTSEIVHSYRGGHSATGLVNVVGVDAKTASSKQMYPFSETTNV